MKRKEKNGVLSKLRKIPQSIMYTGQSDLETSISYFHYNDTTFLTNDDISQISDEYSNLIVVEGFKNQDKIVGFAEDMGVNKFFIEDIFNVTQRNKILDDEDQTFIVMKYPILSQKSLTFRYLSIVIKKNVITLFTDYKNEYVQVLLERVQSNIAMFLQYDVSYVLYAIYDMIIDEQLELAKMYKNQLDDIESDILDLDNSSSKELFMIHRNLVQLRNNARSLSENISAKELLENVLISKKIDSYLTDLEDHIFNLVEKLNTRIDICNSLITMYSTQISTKTNEVMKTLTIISVIFIPLSFMAGVFGMNFTVFPLLSSKYGLIVFFAISIVITASMLFWIKRKKWM